MKKKDLTKKERERKQLLTKLTTYLKTETNIEILNNMSSQEKGVIIKGNKGIWARIHTSGDGKLRLQFLEAAGTDASKTIEITKREALLVIKSVFKN